MACLILVLIIWAVFVLSSAIGFEWLNWYCLVYISISLLSIFILNKFRKKSNLWIFASMFVFCAIMSVVSNFYFLESLIYGTWFLENDFDDTKYILCKICETSPHGFLYSAVIFLFAALTSYSDNMEAKERSQKEKELKKAEEEKRNLKLSFDANVDELKKDFGEPSKIILINQDTVSLQKSIIAFEQSRCIFLMGKKFDFDSILGVEISNNSTVKKAEVQYKTSTSTSGMIGRAIVGGVLTGGVGAIVGGATADKTTKVIPQGEDKIVNDYTVNINVNSFSEPIIRVACGDDSALANEIAGLVNVIIRQNNSQ